MRDSLQARPGIARRAPFRGRRASAPSRTPRAPKDVR